MTSSGLGFTREEELAFDAEVSFHRRLFLYEKMGRILVDALNNEKIEGSLRQLVRTSFLRLSLIILLERFALDDKCRDYSEEQLVVLWTTALENIPNDLGPTDQKQEMLLLRKALRIGQAAAKKVKAVPKGKVVVARSPAPAPKEDRFDPRKYWPKR